MDWLTILLLFLMLSIVVYARVASDSSSSDLIGIPELTPAELATHVLKQSQSGQVPAYWMLKSNWFRPKQLRGKKHIAIAFMTNDMMKKDQCEIRYFDGYHTVIGVDEISKGRIIPPTMVMKQWVLCRDGFRDLTGVFHKKVEN